MFLGVCAVCFYWRGVSGVPVFVQLFYTQSMTGIVDYRKDTKSLNRILAYLQGRGAKIVDVKVSMGMKEGSVKAGVMYLIVYEADTPIEV